MRLLTGFVLVSIYTAAQQPLPAIGEWREHLPYNSAIDVATGNGQVFCATPYSLFSVDLSGKFIDRMSKITGLSETGISTIHFDPANQKLVVAYENSNLDIIGENVIHNVPDIKRDDIIGDKRINHIYSLGSMYFLSTGLGIIIVDGNKFEVKDTWFIGAGGNQARVNGFTSDAGFYYAATVEGLKRVAINIPDPADHTNWQVIGGGSVNNVLNLGGQVLAQRNDSVLAWNGSALVPWYADGWPIVSSSVSNGKLLLCQRMANGSSRVLIINNGIVERSIAEPVTISFPRKAILVNNDTWIADQFGGLSQFSSGAGIRYLPNSPQEKASGEMLVYNKVFYATAGAVNDSWNYQYNGDGIYIFRESSWTNINRYRYPVLDSLLDFITVAVDPRDETVWAGSFGGGLLHIREGPSFEIYKQQFIGPTVNDPGSYRVAGLAFDKDRNLWISNFGSTEPLRVRKNDNNWVNISIPFLLNENAVAQVLVDGNNYKWIVSPLGNGLLCFDHGSSIDNLADDGWKKYSMGNGNGNLPSNEVLSVALDKSGFIWVGTADGVAVIQCPQDVFSAPGCQATWPIVQQGSFAGYLLKGEEVRSIAVDGGNRKWIATSNGAWLVSPDGENIISYFSEDNSPLLSNDIKKVTIDGETGEVYFATLKGLCSFRGTATEGGELNQDVMVFPNPVPPGFSGTIGIRGLVNNAIVRITEMNGRLVYETRANGGQATWDGRNYKGQKISTGVYLVFIRDETNREKQVTKIIFISR